MSFLLLLFLLLLSCLTPHLDATISLRIGVNLGQLGDNLPPPERSIELVRRLRAKAVKIYDANATVLSAVSGTGLRVSVMLPNQLIPSVASNQSFADSWVSSQILPFYPKARIRYLLVGNEILSDYSISNSTWPNLVPAMANLKRSLRSHSIHNIKLGTTLAMDSLSVSFPPSAGAFRPDIATSVITPLLRFLNSTKSFYFVDVYPYFTWAANPSSIDLDYALFAGNPSKYYTDPISGLTYTNLFDQMLDAVFAAMSRQGFGQIPIFVAETGWPNNGDIDQIGANIFNAATYNRNLARRLSHKPPIGTPARPGMVIPAMIFALYNENLKGGPGTERHWGLLYPNGTRVYPVDLTGRFPDRKYPPLPAPTNNAPYKGRIWCVIDEGKKKGVDEKALDAALAYACGQGNGTCDAIEKGRECFRPNTVAAHASYAFNSYWQQFRYSGGTCFFGGLAVQTTKDPSYGSCKFPA
ncbi:putative glucan endo-1,3-beta-D-glucosidase [Dioscorea sansibarensis]